MEIDPVTLVRSIIIAGFFFSRTLPLLKWKLYADGSRVGDDPIWLPILIQLTFYVYYAVKLDFFVTTIFFIQMAVAHMFFSGKSRGYGRNTYESTLIMFLAGSDAFFFHDIDVHGSIFFIYDLITNGIRPGTGIFPPMDREKTLSRHQNFDRDPLWERTVHVFALWNLALGIFFTYVNATASIGDADLEKNAIYIIYGPSMCTITDYFPQRGWFLYLTLAISPVTSLALQIFFDQYNARFPQIPLVRGIHTLVALGPTLLAISPMADVITEDLDDLEIYVHAIPYAAVVPTVMFVLFSISQMRPHTGIVWNSAVTTLCMFGFSLINIIITRLFWTRSTMIEPNAWIGYAHYLEIAFLYSTAVVIFTS